MTYIVTDGNVFLVDRCLTATYINTVVNETFDRTHNHQKILDLSTKEWYYQYKNEKHKIMVGAFTGLQSHIEKITQMTNHTGDINNSFYSLYTVSGDSNYVSFIGITESGLTIEVELEGHKNWKKNTFIHAGCGGDHTIEIIKIVPKTTPLEAMVLAYRADPGVSRNFDYWHNGKVIENVTLTEKQEAKIIENINKRVDFNLLNIKGGE